MSDFRTGCWFCGSEMIWNSDFNFEDYCMEGEGVVASLSCSNSKCNATANFFSGQVEQNEGNEGDKNVH